MLNGVILLPEVPLSWKRGFDSEVIILQKQRYCSDCYTYSMFQCCRKATNRRSRCVTNVITF